VELYDRIGQGYNRSRRPDPRIAELILRALGTARSVVNVGAGTGSYEPTDRYVVAVEPSRTMIRQRPSAAAPVVQASAHDLPFSDGVFAAALATLTVHHWPDRLRGLRELRRVAREQVVLLTWDPSASRFWLIDEYFPELEELDRCIFPTIEDLERALGHASTIDVPIPHDCTDGFLGAYWRRPRAYLDPEVRSAISAFAKLSDVERRLERLRRALDSGEWEHRHRDLLSASCLDLGYRLIVARKQ
jgi:SAM-dependent methyltransferase